MKNLPNITLIGIDCVNLERLQIAADVSTKDITFGAVKLLSSVPSKDPRVIPIKPIRSQKAYSEFIIKELDHYIDTDFALIFQWDGFILNPDAWSDDFLKHDYIGAPWYHLGDLRVGNGGFSLRSKKLITWLAKNWNQISARINPEDVFISKFARPYLEKAGFLFAPEVVAAQFAKEGNRHSVVWNGEFGFHGITYTDISRWLNVHPEYKEQLSYKTDDYVKLMKKYPIFDGTVHTLDCRKYDMKDYRLLSEGRKTYEIRAAQTNRFDLRDIKTGDTIVFKRHSVRFRDVPISAFERKVSKIESFNSFDDLRRVYPHLSVTYPWENLANWQRPIVKLFGDLFYPKKQAWLVFWLEEKE